MCLPPGHEPPRPMSLPASEAAYEVQCNEDQVAAVAGLTEGIFLVHGPPGTGATLCAAASHG